MVRLEIGEKVYRHKEIKRDELPKSERKTRLDKKIRVNPPLDGETHDLLLKLALACRTSKTNLAAELLKEALRNLEIVNKLQDQFGADRYRVIPTKIDGIFTY